MLRLFFSFCKTPFITTEIQNLKIKVDNNKYIMKKLLNLQELIYIKSQLSNIKIDGKQQLNIDLTIQNDKIRLDQILYTIEQPIKIPWYPRYFQDLDKTGFTTIQINEDVGNDSPQFTDQKYRIRRKQIANFALNHKINFPIPIINYNDTQIQTWKIIYFKLKNLHTQGMCQRSIYFLNEMDKYFSMKERIPQLKDLNQFLKQKTGFTIKPTVGIVSQRQFLNCFAHRAFCCTQYIRHQSIPQYTPEPDIVHQIVGHIPMFSDPSIAQFSQQLGLLSLGATDQQISALSTLYWFTIQFGVCKQNGKYKGYGAGIGSSIGELNNLLSNQSKFKKLIPSQDAYATYTIQAVQDIYRYVNSFDQALIKLRQFGKNIIKPVNMFYDFNKKQVLTNRSIETFI